jgi:cobyrinic acid a,c-diamide synthase
LGDRTLPDNVHGLYFGGGFPEVFAAQLSENEAAREAVRAAIERGMPTYAECGGLMYLAEKIVDFAGVAHEMVGVLPIAAHMGKKLILGYRQAQALQDTPLLQQGDSVHGHEFHRSTLSNSPRSPLYHLQSYNSPPNPVPEGWATLPNLHASYLHLHWGATPEIPGRFLQSCRFFWEGKGERGKGKGGD